MVEHSIEVIEGYGFEPRYRRKIVFYFIPVSALPLAYVILLLRLLNLDCCLFITAFYCFKLLFFITNVTNVANNFTAVLKWYDTVDSESVFIESFSVYRKDRSSHSGGLWHTCQKNYIQLGVFILNRTPFILYELKLNLLYHHFFCATFIALLIMM